MISFNPKRDIVGIFGKQGTGKTLLMIALGKQFHDQGIPIYSNTPLSFKHTLIHSIDELEKMRYGVALLDEMWLWVSARTSMTKMNQELMRIIMLNRKRKISIFYTAQLEYQADRLLRGVTRYFLYPHIEPSLIINTGYGTDIDKILFKEMGSPRGLTANIYDDGYDYRGKIILDDISNYFDIYKTEQEIDLLNKKKGERPGYSFEKEVYEELCEQGGSENFILFPGSGKNLPWPGDIGAIQNYTITHIIDPKTKLCGPDAIDIRPGFYPYIDMYKRSGILGSIAFKKNGTIYYTPITLDKPFIKNRRSVVTRILQENGMPIKKFWQWLTTIKTTKTVINYV